MHSDDNGITAEELMRLLGNIEHVGVLWLEPDTPIDPAATRLVPQNVLGKENGVPRAFGVQIRDGRLVVAFIAWPYAAEIAEVSTRTGMPITPALFGRSADGKNYKADPAAYVAAAGQAASLISSVDSPKLTQVLEISVDDKASDIHLEVGHPPVLRKAGILSPIRGMLPLSAPDMKEMAEWAAGTVLRRQGLTIPEDGPVDLDCAISYSGSRFLVNIGRQRESLFMTLRRIPNEIPSAKDLGLPSIWRTLTELDEGLVLITGPTGSGKSTTLASIIDSINQSRACRIITLEDPIEYEIGSKAALVAQREIGTDTPSFAEGLRRVLRQDPDIIMVGEIRDPETAAIALQAAETGHLVFSTVHTRSAVDTVTRLVQMFEPARQSQITTIISSALKAVITQALLPDCLEPGRLWLAAEVLQVTPAVASLIRDGKIHQIGQQMTQAPMQTMARALRQLVDENHVDAQRAQARLDNAGKEEFNRRIDLT